MANAATAHVETFAELLDATLGADGTIEGVVLRGVVVGHRPEHILVDVGLKSEGFVPIREFQMAKEALPAVGDEVDVYIERYEDRNGEVQLSREKARREESWVELEKAFIDGQKVTGSIFSKVKGGYIVDLSGAMAFLPNSQVDVRPIRDITPLIGVEQPFALLKMDRRRGNIVVSRRAVMEETRAEARTEFVSNLTEGAVLDGVVKNITEYGAFVDLGGVDGLLHVTDISWKRVNHPSEALQVGQTVTVKVIRFNEETKRISLGMKQLSEDPWMAVKDRFKPGDRLKGTVTNVTDYGAFVELENGIEGLVHVSEMSWTKKNPDPSKIIGVGQQAEVMVLEVDEDKRRISLGLKQCQENPWQAFQSKHPAGSDVEATVRAVQKDGLAVVIAGFDIEAFVPAGDLSWEGNHAENLKKFNQGDKVNARIMDIDSDRDRVLLSVKHLLDDPVSTALGKAQKGAVITCTVSVVQDNGIEVMIGDAVKSFIKRSDLARDRADQRPDRFAVGEKVDALITSIDRKSGKVSLSIKGREIQEEKAAMEEFGSTDSGASLGDILGPAIRQARKDGDD